MATELNSYTIEETAVVVEQKPRSRPVTLRAVLLGIPLIIVNVYWLMASWGRAGYASGQSFPTVVSLYFNAVFSLVLLLAVNGLLRKVAPRFRLSEAELLTIYIMLTVASSMAGHDMLEILWPMIAYATWFTTPGNHWGGFQRYIPSWLTIKDRAAVTDFYLGNSSLYRWDHITLWLLPVGIWTALILVLGMMMLFMVVVLKERWVRQERLSYPNILVPMAMTDPQTAFFKNRLMWTGFLIAFGMDLINGLHHLYPQVPGLGGALFETDLSTLFTTRPFSAIGWTPVAVYPFVIGMTFFIPLDLSFSIWFFFLFGKMTRVFGDMAGTADQPGFPYPMEQSAGAWIGLAGTAVWASRRYLLDRFKTAWRTPAREEGEPLSPRTALIGLLLGTLFLIGFGQAAGVSLWLMLTFFLLFFAISIAITRVRAEVGPPSHDVMAHPTMMMVTCLGPERIGMPGLTLFSHFNAFNRTYRSHPMPCMLEGFAIASRRNIASRPLLGAMIVALVVGTLASAWAFFDHAYRYGGAIFGERNQCAIFLDQLAAWNNGLASAHAPGTAASVGAGGQFGWPGIFAMLIGLAGTFGLMALRRRFLWWPLHPAGYAISLGLWNTTWFWFSILIGWLLKWALLHGGGLRTYHRSVPFFMGVILGEFMMGSLWSLLGIALGMPMYRFLQ